MQTPEPLTIYRLYKLCELAKTSEPDSLIKVKREELWALVEMAKTVACCCGHNSQDGQIDLEDGRILIIKQKSTAPTNETGNARPGGE